MTEAERLAKEWVFSEYPTLEIKAVIDRYKKAFLAGYRAGKPKWHDLRKDPNDLPNERKDYLCKFMCYNSEDTFDAVVLFKTERKAFLFEENDGDAFDVTAWCEIPKWEEVEE